MKRAAEYTLYALGLVAALWLAGNLLLDVQLPEPDRDVLPPERLTAELSLWEAFEALPDGGAQQSRVHLLADNATAWAERWRLLHSAEQRLDISYFILKQDVFGAAFLGLLVKRARDGVRIRVLLDAMGTQMSRNLRGNDYLDALVNAPNVAVRMYRPLPYRYLDAFLTLNPAAILASDHDKVLIADGERLLMGGRNISREYFAPPEDDPGAFRDTDVLLSGRPISAAAEAAFEAQFGGGEAHPVRREAIDLRDSTGDLELARRAMEAWLRDRPVPPDVVEAIRAQNLPWLDELSQLPQLRGALNRPRPEATFARVRLLDSRTRLIERDAVSTGLVRLVRSAERQVFVQSPYLVLLEPAAELLRETGARGVAIDLLTNSPLSSDNAWSQAFFLQQWPKLLARIPNLRIAVPGDRRNLHGKIAVIDRRLSLVGTYNLDPLSMALNGEMMLAIWSEPFAERLMEEPAMLTAAGPPALYRYRIAEKAGTFAALDTNAQPTVAFGPDGHLRPEQWDKTRRYRRILQALTALPGCHFLLDACWESDRKAAGL